MLFVYAADTVDIAERCRFPPDIHDDVDDGSERQPGCPLAAADHQRMDRDDEQGQWQLGDLQPDVGWLP